MGMSAELRLQAMIRAMSEVILPAIPADQKLALDQGAILLGNLKLLADQQGHEWDFEMAELREHLDLIEGMVATAGGGPRAQSAAADAALLLAQLAPVAAQPYPSQPALADMARRARLAAETLVEAAGEDGSAAFKAAVAKSVMAQAQTQIVRERVWNRAAGFDPQSASMPSIAEVLAPQGGRARGGGDSHVAVDDIGQRMQAAREVVGDGPVLMLNMLRFRQLADYSAHPELASKTPISGRQAYLKYLELLAPRMKARGSEISFMGSGGPFLIGPAQERWDMVFFGSWPSLAVLAASPADPEYRSIVGHRTAALEDSRLLPVRPEPPEPAKGSA